MPAPFRQMILAALLRVRPAVRNRGLDMPPCIP
jgi:hypothetical protein